jgi:hypothetical protein
VSTHNDSAATTLRRRRSKVDGKLRYPCPRGCGRLEAINEDWSSDEINEGDRDDLCWGAGANCETEWPDTNA